MASVLAPPRQEQAGQRRSADQGLDESTLESAGSRKTGTIVLTLGSIP
ncbi:MAG: hypothetical protein ABSB24_11705 [Gaiellaceae bacterium]